MNKFVSEKEIHENREKFGIKVDGEDENYDPRPLYEKLQEKKDQEEESFRDRFKSQPPKAMDEDEYGFLQEQADKQSEYERQIHQQDEEQLKEFAAAQAHLSIKPPSTIESKSKIIPTRSIPKVKTFKKPKKKRKNSLLASVRVIRKEDTSTPSTISKQEAENIKRNVESKINENKSKEPADSPDPLLGFLTSYQGQ
mmetsp:Transcript_16294/g.20839  ORF Transcript_16294/g.20839 Transcript_16294/m.20839 type:complete len:197 (+) Transcript_16294:1309-1899(+)